MKKNIKLLILLLLLISIKLNAQNFQKGFDDDIEKHISLKYHLEQRNIFVNEINYKTKLGKNSFLYGNDDFGRLEKGTS